MALSHRKSMNMVPTPEQASAGYHAMWSRAAIRPEKKSAAIEIALRIVAHRDVYESIEKKAGVPWYMVAAIHNRESSLSLRAHLHNGDALAARTHHVPVGRPKAGAPPFTFGESAIDALTMAPHRLDQVKHWSVERMLYECEKYNGWGYLKHGPSPYLWSWTAMYRGGKYVKDGVYDPDAWDRQAGCAAVLKTLAAIEPGVAAGLENREPVPPKQVLDQGVHTERAARSAGGVLAGGGAATEGIQQLGAGTRAPDNPAPALIPAFVTYGAVGIGMAVLLVAAVLIVRKRNFILTKWGAAC
jgi:lysozyme family protein